MHMFARRLRAARLAVGFDSVVEFAAAISISPKRYQKFEAGKAMPDPDELIAISRVTARSIDFLVTGKRALAA